MKRWLALVALASLVSTWLAAVCEVAARDFRSGNRATREEERVFRTPADDADAPPPVPQETPAAKPPKKPKSWRSMLRGLFTGGLIGTIFFGRSFRGVGLLEVVLLSALIAAAFWGLSRYDPEPTGHYAHAAAYGGSLRTAPAVGLSGSGGPLMRAGPAREPVDLREAAPALDPAELTTTIEEMFRRVQAAWTARDIAQVGDLLTPELRERLAREAGRLRASRRVNRVERIAVQRVAVTEAWQHDGWDRLRVRITATLVDYTTDEVGLKVLAGNPFDPVPFQEQWDLVRPSGPYPWRVIAIG
jgi:predicted lipid-binding transport protein (Tim44 family)